MRTDHDSIGPVCLEDDCYWGAQTQRSLINFPVGPTFPFDFIKSYVLLKKCAAKANVDVKKIDKMYLPAIIQACEEMTQGKFAHAFPLKIFQTGSGTQTNMNVNEVLANRCNEILGNPLGSYTPLHPNDHINASQSSNDTFPTAMHIALTQLIHEHLLPSMETFIETLKQKEKAFSHIIKIGRTHLQDATPLTLGHVFSSYRAQMEHAFKGIQKTLPRLRSLVMGGTAVGTGLNCPKGFSQFFLKHLNNELPYAFTINPSFFEGIAAHDALVECSGALNALAVAVHKIIHDLRMLASGPRCGLGELVFPQNEPGSSIMPGKVNPTQAEALCMICVQVMGHHTAISIAGTHGHFELNTYKPLMFLNLYQSIQWMSQGLKQFHDKCLVGIEADEARIQALMEQSLMLVTALAPHLGYEIAATIAKKAHQSGRTLKDVAIHDGYIEPSVYETLVVPKNMVG
jgi:fumarate hydratase class II